MTDNQKTIDVTPIQKKTTKKKVTPNRPSVKKKLNLKQQQFINNYTNIDNPKTFGNGTQSVQAVYQYKKDTVAAVTATNLLKNTNVLSALEQQIEQLDMGSKVRLSAIRQVITGSYKQRTVSTSTDKDGNVYESTSERSPTASEVLKAVDLTEKISGTYDKNKAKEDLRSSVLKDLMRKHTKELTGDRGGGKRPSAS